ncbi:MAG: flagellar basal body P-ring formation chaperone FlgA [Desulfosalsimonadaceae bacterium]
MKQWLLIALLIFCCPGLVLGLEVQFKEDAVTGGEMLTVGDVARLRPAASAAGLAGVKLFPAPSAGRRKCFQSSTLKAYIREAVADKENIEWSGAEIVCVRKQGRLVTAEKIRSVVNARIQKELKHLGAKDVCFKPRRMPDSISLPPGSVSYEVIFKKGQILDSRKATVVIKLDGRTAKTLTIPGKVQAFLPVVLAAEDLRRNTKLTRSNIRTETKNIAEIRDPCVSMDAAAGKQLKHSVSMNQVIRSNDLVRPLMVKRRQIVTMLLQKGPMRIKARGRAASDGRKGEVIMVENMRSNREVPCRVVGDGLTRVDY